VIITKLTLENYKQYRGEHVFPIAEDATIGVVGANGVGKTTIFEAIEWCLYNPRSIQNTSIRPRGTGGEIRVVVELATSDGAQVYEVERILKRSTTQAAVYKMNEMGGGDPVVQGTRDVTDYISTKLIGLGHSAFVATFFTRQKELGFFGEMRPTERRREVSKLLGYETIKQAQNLIGDDRSKARTDADALQDLYEARSGDRDFPAEITAAREELAAQREMLDAATTALQKAEAVTAEREQEVARLQERRDRHTAVAGDLRDLQTRSQHAGERQAAIAAELEQLARREEERAQLAGVAAREPELRTERERLDAERERHERRERLRGEMRGCGQTVDQGVADARAIVDRARQATTDPGWSWSELDDRRPTDAINRLSAVARASDLAGVQARLNLYLAAVAEQKRLDVEAGTLGKYRQRQQQLKDDLRGLLEGGEPAELRGKLETRQDAAKASITEARSRIATVSEQEARARDLIGKLEHQHFDEECPTCGRAFSDDDARFTIERMHETVDRCQAETAEARTSIATAEAELMDAQQELARVQDAERRIAENRARLASGADYVEQQEAKVAAQETALHAVLEQIGLPSTPNVDEITEVERAVMRSRALHDTIEPLAMIRRAIVDAQESIQRHEASLAELTDIAWDPERYREVSERHNAAASAAGAVKQIDRELSRRPQLEHDRDAVAKALGSLREQVAEQQVALEAVGHDPEALQAAATAYQQARQDERVQREAVTGADRVVRDVGYRLASLERDEEQVKDIAVRAEEKRRQWQELDLMYREFSEFDKYVAQKLTPQLSEITSDIVAAMTDGKYDQVVFDEDYGIEVYDSTDEKFPLETFSGGERDAIALAARLALSRMIGSQAANPPSFLVLDEVFGSLDAERRERVLALLGQHSHEFFRQMFVISHVDDVQQSPVFDTIWQVVQLDDGSSDVNVVSGDAALVE
jgi:exonuclease SbcC